jgi:hypothetical protein
MIQFTSGPGGTKSGPNRPVLTNISPAMIPLTSGPGGTKSGPNRPVLTHISPATLQFTSGPGGTKTGPNREEPFRRRKFFYKNTYLALVVIL